MTEPRRFESFREFWPFYLGEHSHPVCRALHYTGSLLVVALCVVALGSGRLGLLALTPVVGYGFAWVGHFLVEKNRPATFKYPLYSLAADWVMLYTFLTGRMGEALGRAREGGISPTAEAGRASRSA